MGDPARIKNICKLLEKAWSYFPEQRMGQFLINSVFGSFRNDSHIYHKEDEEVETILNIFIEKFDKFKQLPEDEEVKERELFLKRIYKQNKNYVDKPKED